MKIFIITDTHFNHLKMIELCNRPENYESMIWSNLENLPLDSLLIHLGDICIGNEAVVHGRMAQLKFRKVLVRGNHDHKSNNWYMNNGWDFVCDRFNDRMYGKNIAFSHKPIKDDGYDVNIHGHFHNSDHHRHEPELLAIKNDKQKLLILEENNYSPVALEKYLINNEVK